MNSYFFVLFCISTWSYIVAIVLSIWHIILVDIPDDQVFIKQLNFKILVLSS